MIKNRKITAAEVVRILKKHGTHITLDEAEKVVDFLYTFGSMALETVLKKPPNK